MTLFHFCHQFCFQPKKETMTNPTRRNKSPSPTTTRNKSPNNRRDNKNKNNKSPRASPTRRQGDRSPPPAAKPRCVSPKQGQQQQQPQNHHKHHHRGERRRAKRAGSNHLPRPDAVIFPPDPNETGKQTIERIFESFGLKDTLSKDCQLYINQLLKKQHEKPTTSNKNDDDDNLTNETHIPYITVDSEGARDLDQAMYIRRKDVPQPPGKETFASP